MATSQMVYLPPDGVLKVVGDKMWLGDGHQWSVQTVIENRDNGEQLLRMEIPDEDLLTCDGTEYVPVDCR
jgi:hypothetical protein